MYIIKHNTGNLNTYIMGNLNKLIKYATYFILYFPMCKLFYYIAINLVFNLNFTISHYLILTIS